MTRAFWPFVLCLTACVHSKTLAPVTSAALAGDVREAMRKLELVEVAALDSKDRAVHACLVESFRHGRPPPVTASEPFVRDVVEAYRAYWTKVLMRELDAAAGEAVLLARLNTVLGAEHATMKLATAALGEALESRGYRSIRGVTRPYWDLMIWHTQTGQTYPVALPERSLEVNVDLLQNFDALGWSHFATCGKAFTGGWASKDRLYCVADSYDLKSEAFSVSYLAHEGQHFADYQAFPKLEQPELEYRAKLVELALAKETTRALALKFDGQQGASRHAPHNFANAHVVKVMARKLGPAWLQADDEAIHAAARAALLESSEALRALGAETVARWLAE